MAQIKIKLDSNVQNYHFWVTTPIHISVNPQSTFVEKDKKNGKKVKVNNLARNGRFYQILLKMCSFVSGIFFWGGSKKVDLGSLKETLFLQCVYTLLFHLCFLTLVVLILYLFVQNYSLSTTNVFFMSKRSVNEQGCSHNAPRWDQHSILNRNEI